MRLLFLSLLGALAVHNMAAAACPPAGVSRAELVALQATDAAVADNARRQSLALGLLDCLSDPDPVLREETAFPALETWMRGDKLDAATLRAIRISQLAALSKPDAAGFAQPFAILALAELVRADRIKPFMSEGERGQIVQAGTAYLGSVRDYRGYDEKEGWRHAVAHAADLMRELSRHPALGKKDQQLVLAAVAAQLSGAGALAQFYHYEEGARMARPLFYMAARSEMSAAEWDAWFVTLGLTPAERTSQSNVLFARRHNLKSLLMPLYIALIESKDAAQRERLLPAVEKALGQFK